MGEITEKKDRREIYRALITDPQTAGTFKKYSFTEFESKLLSDEKAATTVAQRMVSKGLVPNMDSFFEQYINEPAPKPVAQQAPSRPVQVPPLLQPAQPSQGPSLTQVTGQQAMMPQFQPFQFQNEKEIQQAAKSPVFLANKPAMQVMADREQMAEANPLTWRQNEATGKYGVFEKDAPINSKPLAEFDNMNQAAAAIKTRGAASNALIMPTKEAEQEFQKMSPEEQQAAIQGGTGGKLAREADEKKKTLRQKIAESINSVKSYGSDLVKSAKRGWEQGNAIQTAKLTDLATGNAEGIDFDAMAKANKVVRDMGATETELDFAQSDGIWDDISDWMKMVLPVAIESTATLVSSGLEEIGVGAATGGAIGSVIPGAGTVAGAATGAMGGVSTAGYNMELYASILDGLDEKGVDVTNPAALKKAFSDKELMSPILSRANKRAAIIGVVDLVGGEMIGHSGRMLKNAEKAGKMSKGMGRLIRAVDRTRGLDEAFTGSAGELAAQVGSGQDVNLQEVGLEGVGGAPMVALQGALSRAGQGNQAPTQPKTPPSQLGGIPTQPVSEKITENPEVQSLIKDDVDRLKEYIKEYADENKSRNALGRAVDKFGNFITFDVLNSEKQYKKKLELLEKDPIAYYENEIKEREAYYKKYPKELEGDTIEYKNRWDRDSLNAIKAILQKQTPVTENAPAFTPEVPVAPVAPVAPIVTPEAPAIESDTEYVTVTPEELDAFKQGTVDPERAAAVAEDADAVMNGELTLEAIDDPNYREMVALTLQTDETTTTTTPSPSLLGETTEATGQTGGGVGTDVQAVDETITDETPLNPAPIPVAADATGGTTADVGTEPVAPESGGSEVEAEPVLAEEVAPAPAEEEVDDIPDGVDADVLPEEPDAKVFTGQPTKFHGEIPIVLERKDAKKYGIETITLPAVYIRLGALPRNEQGGVSKSGVFLNGERVGEEDGVSVFEAGYDKDSDRYIIYSGNGQLSTSLTEAAAQGRKIYLVDGKEVGNRGSDFEPVINPSTIKVLGEIPSSKVIDDNQLVDGMDIAGNETEYTYPKTRILETLQERISKKQAERQKTIEHARENNLDSANYEERTGKEIKVLQDLIDELAPKQSPFESFNMKGEEGRKARAALKEEVGKAEFARLESIHKKAPEILKGLEERGVIKIECP